MHRGQSIRYERGNRSINPISGKGIRVKKNYRQYSCTVAPGAIETDFGGGAVRDNQKVNDFIASQTALGRIGVPDDIGDAIASLLSEDNRWVNAQRIEIFKNAG